MDSKTLENQRVLIVDDQRAFQLMFKGILYSMGATNVAFAPTGEQALAKCANIQYDILFVDYHLGSGKNGRQLLEDLREKKLLKPHSIFMLVTGENTIPLVVSAVELEPDDYLVKPFSQSVLRSRLQKLQRKKLLLRSLYQAMHDDDIEQVISFCRQKIAEESRYQQYCKRVLVESLLKLQHYGEAEQILLVNLQKHRSNWALLLQAKLCHEQQRYEESVQYCQEAIDNNRLLAEAFDIQAQCYMALHNPEQAFSCIMNAAEIAPHSLPRQYLVMDIARAQNDMTTQVQASKLIHEITRRSFRQDISHLLNYIRTVLDAAMQTEEPQQRNRFLQEVAIALQRVRRDDILTREIDFDLFETLCQARLESLSGQQYQAKKTYASIAGQLENQPETLPDTVFLLNQIGEFEQAESLQKHLTSKQLEDPVLARLFSEQERLTDTKQKRFSQLNKEGIRSYKAGHYTEAVQLFEQALELAPMNTGSALNLIQATLQLINNQPKHKTHELFERSKKAFRIVDNMPLPEHHQIRYAELLAQFDKLRQQLHR